MAAVPWGVMILGPSVFGFLAGLLSLYFLYSLGSLVGFVGWVLTLVLLWKMGKELREVNGTFEIWKAIILPFIFVPDEMTKAKQMRGVQAPARSLVVYLFLPTYAFAADLNDIANAPQR